MEASALRWGARCAAKAKPRRAGRPPRGPASIRVVFGGRLYTICAGVIWTETKPSRARERMARTAIGRQGRPGCRQSRTRARHKAGGSSPPNLAADPEAERHNCYQKAGWSQASPLAEMPFVRFRWCIECAMRPSRVVAARDALDQIVTPRSGRDREHWPLGAQSMESRRVRRPSRASALGLAAMPRRALRPRADPRCW